VELRRRFEMKRIKNNKLRLILGYGLVAIGLIILSLAFGRVGIK
jgi:uncharacterized protein YjeT (DUF2065 family)